MSTDLAAPVDLRVEHRHEIDRVLGTGVAAPRLSWIVPGAPEGWRQSAYEVEITRADVTTLHRVDGPGSAEQVLVPWPGEPLRSREAVTLRVRVQDERGTTADRSAWSSPLAVEAGLLDAGDWTADVISPTGVGGEGMPAPRLAGRFQVPGEVASARLYITAHGILTAELNGHRVGQEVLAPGWTSYEHRLRYRTHDVTDLVRSGGNDLDVLLGNGWYRGRLGYTDDRALYGHRLALLAQLEVRTADGELHVFGTDSGWTARECEVVEDDLYDGQRTDLRRRGPKWTAPVGGVEVLEADRSRLVAGEQPPMCVTATLPAAELLHTPSGATVVDFGQNAVGWVRLRVRGLAAGTEVVVRHAEVMEDGEIATVPLRTARATDTYVLAGPDETVLEPSLTLHGFRYAEISGVPDLRAQDVELVVVGTDLRRTGWFASSHDLLDRFHENVVWSTRGNFVDLPTDCPQRDERLGWTGDAQVFGPTATFLYDVTALLESWLADLAAEQLPDGSVPHVVPDVNGNGLAFTPAAAWGDAAVIVPWTLYERTGDAAVLERQFLSMRGWVDRIADLAGPDRLWRSGFQYGDWLDPTAPPEEADKAIASPEVVATAHLVRSADLLARAAVVLRRDDDAQKYAALAAETRAAFADAYVSPAGRVHSDAQTVYALALQWDLLPTQRQRRLAGDRLADLVRLNGFRIGTGFVGTPLICDALTAAGHHDVAFRLLLQTACPSWLYPVTMGATTIWERWDSLRPDGSVNPGGMTSFNHYALGAVADWLHRSVAGLAPAAPGYRRVTVRPVLGTALDRAEARHLTPYGEAAVEWSRQDGRLRLSLTLPVGTTGQVFLPGTDSCVEVGPGTHRWDVPDPVRAAVARDWTAATVRDVLDDARAWEPVATAAVTSGAFATPAAAAAKLGQYLDLPVARLGAALVPDDRFTGAQEVRRAVEALLHPAP